MNIKKISSVLILLIPVLSVTAQTLWCPKSGIAGFENEASTAKHILASNTSDLDNMEVYITVKGNDLYIQSNYVPPGGEYPLKIATDEALYNMKDLIKYLINPDAFQDYNPAFERSYGNNMVLYADASVLTDAKYKNLQWGEANHVKIIDGSSVFNTEVLPGSGERVVKVQKNTYIALQSEDVCEVADQLSKIKDAIDKFDAINANKLHSGDVSITGNDEAVEAAAIQPSWGDFFNSIASSGLTLVNLTCDPAGTMKDIVFDVYRENAEENENTKVGTVSIQLPEQQTSLSSSSAAPDDNIAQPGTDPTDDEGTSKGLGTGWYVVIGLVVIAGIRAIAKQG